MTEDILKVVQDVMEEHKAQDVCVMDLPSFAMASHMVVAAGTSARHLWTLADKVSRAVRPHGVRALVEGDAQSDWIAVDLGHVIVHFFTEEKRKLYDLESLWMHAVQEEAAASSVDKER